MDPIVIPALGLELNIDRVAFTVLGKSIYWYGIIIAFAFVLAVVYCYYNADRFGIIRDKVIDFILFAAPGGIIGARIYYVVFYQSIYRNADGSFNWGKAVAIWDGGLAIYGGVIAAILILLVFCAVNKIKFLAFADLGSYGLLIGQSIGRWGNFINQEAYGCETTLPWRMGLTVGGAYIEVHPTFLYESLWNVVGLVFAHFVLRKHRKFDGEVFLFYLAWYGLGRMWIEGLRTDSLYLFNTGIRVSQLLAGLCFLIAGLLLLVLVAKLPSDPDRLYVHQIAAAKAAPDDVIAQEEAAGATEATRDVTEEEGAAPERAGTEASETIPSSETDPIANSNRAAEPASGPIGQESADASRDTAQSTDEHEAASSSTDKTMEGEENGGSDH